MKCNHCGNVFKNNSILKQHQRTAKYCLSLQTTKTDYLSISTYNCKYCRKTLSQKIDLDRHYVICKKKLDQENQKQCNKKTESLYIRLKEKDTLINELKIQVQTLQDKLENIAIKAVERPTTTNMSKNINNYIQNMQPISSDHLLEQSSNLTLAHIQKGASGYAEYALEYPLKDRIACVDYSRRKMKFKDNNGNLITDPEMVKLAPMFFDSIKNKSSQIVYDLNNKDIDSSMFEEVAKVFNTNSDVKNGASGMKTDFYHDFVKHVCSGSVIE
jgi:hypothetical protein